MYGLALGIEHVENTLPSPVYALISGLNAATVGIIALAAVQLSQKAITDKLTRILVFLGGTAGMLYNALWYFPVLMVAGGAATVAWDLRQDIVRLVKRKEEDEEQAQTDGEGGQEMRDMGRTSGRSSPKSVHSMGAQAQASTKEVTASQGQPELGNSAAETTSPPKETEPPPLERTVSQTLTSPIFNWKLGVTIAAFFFVTFVALMTLRGTLKTPPLAFSLFANMFLAGTIIFGGGPVVIPLLREYIVAPGWVSARNFLLGLAIIQAFPGPNFNCTHPPFNSMVCISTNASGQSPYISVLSHSSERHSPQRLAPSLATLGSFFPVSSSSLPRSPSGRNSARTVGWCHSSEESMPRQSDSSTQRFTASGALALLMRSSLLEAVLRAMHGGSSSPPQVSLAGCGFA